jgi:Lar family restriction alleviation protein
MNQETSRNMDTLFAPNDYVLPKKPPAPLKPCPFCGRVPEPDSTRGASAYTQVRCKGCEALGPMAVGTQRAQMVWDKRNEGR